MLTRLFNFLFGCSHRRMSSPLTIRRPDGDTDSYVTCLDCGADYDYDVAQMCQGRRRVYIPIPTHLTPPPTSAHICRVCGTMDTLSIRYAATFWAHPECGTAKWGDAFFQQVDRALTTDRWPFHNPRPIMTDRFLRGRRGVPPGSDGDPTVDL